MANRLLISFLGVGNYFECRYRMDGRAAEPTVFPSVALARLLAPGPDKVLLAATEKARERYWERLRSEWPEDGPELERIEIPEASGKEEFWTIFSRLNEAAPDGATVSLDITHSFRHLPMLGFAVLHYLREVRGVAVGGIYYGAYEADNASPPIFDLTEFLEVNAWADALGDVRKHGSTERLRGMIAAEVRPVLAETGGRDASAWAMGNLNEALEEWAEACRFARGPELQDFDVNKRILKSLDAVSEEWIPALGPELKGIREFFEACAPVGSENLWHAARWCRDHDLIQQGLTLLQEGFITRWAEVDREIASEFNDLHERREYLASVLGVANKKSVRDDPSKWDEALKTRETLTRSILSRLPSELSDAFGALTDARNDFNHAGYRENERPIETLRKELSAALEKLRPYFRVPEGGDFLSAR